MSVFPTIVDDKDDFQQNAPPSLPPIYARFFVPQLLDQPQDPIIDTLKRTKNERHHPAEFNSPPRLIDFKEVWEGLARANVESVEDIWEVAVRRHGGRSQTYSWDALRTISAIHSSSTGLLSEQDHIMFAAARHHVQPRLHDPDVDVQYVYQSDLLDDLKMTALGTSSLLHKWDASNEGFEEVGRGCGKRTVIIVYGKDEVTSRSLISPFLTIGTTLRRLEKLVLDLRFQTSGAGPTIHAFAHALSTCLTFIRQSLDDCSSQEVETKSDDNMCSVLWHYKPWEEILVVLATLCNRQSVSPDEYQPLPTSPETIISLLYDTLKFHLEIRSPRITSSILAFMLTETSRDYIETIGRSVGLLGGASGQKPGVSDEVFEIFPTFFSSELVTALPIARKSLGLLRAARPDHPISTQKCNSFALWFWTHEEIEQSFNNFSRETPGESNSVESTVIEEPYSKISYREYREELTQFRVFDLQPGLGIGCSYFDRAYTAAPEVRLRHFIDAFPEALPSVTPTLDHLAALVLRPLLDRCVALSTTLLSIFLSLPPPLSLHSHLKVMRSYMLLMSPSFKARLSSALFSDSTDFFPDVQSGHKFSLGSLRRHPHGGDVRDRVWAVGLAPALLERDVWPPVGTDLSFFLRTVIMDSFVGGKAEGGNREEAVEEVESRLGFALKESDRNASWSNPLVVEALDFLYMDYKPPHPLDVVITPDIVYKYQRLFSLLLRILRVESAIAAVFRMTRPSMPPLFPTLTLSHKLLHHFRFVAQSFVSSLSEYVYDTAIGGNFVPFLDKVCEGGTAHFSDVFSLAESHSETMNDILTACLVRTNLRVSATLLRDCLNTILEFAVVIGELFRGRLQEYEAAPMIDDLFTRFRKKTASFVSLHSF
uniref:Spindle pole body component n=1 Tax=Moniliophthora roreri TaxID=221103 RepID=A0A0W0F116_MONRR